MANPTALTADDLAIDLSDQAAAAELEIADDRRCSSLPIATADAAAQICRTDVRPMDRRLLLAKPAARGSPALPRCAPPTR